MRTVSNLLESSERLDLSFLARLAFIDAGDFYVGIQCEQLGEGRLSTGKPITNVKTGRDTYSPSYAAYKGFDKPINLHDKGDFWAEIFIVDNDKEIIVDSLDSKSAMLQENYSDQILGLDADSRVKFAPFAAQSLIDVVVTEINRR